MEKSEAEHTSTCKQLQDEVSRLSGEGLVAKEKLGLAESNLLVLKSEMTYKDNDYRITKEKLETNLDSKISLMQLSE